MTTLANRHEFVLLFDVKNGNPNGDPDSGNMPRIDQDTRHGLVTDVCLKRKIRDFVQMFGGEGSEIFVRSRVPLNPLIAEGVAEKGFETFAKSGGGWDNTKAKARSQSEISIIQKWLCAKYFDIRTFGGVLSTGPNAGQIRGPVQIGFGESIDPILPAEISITRVTDVDKEEGEMGRKHIVPYGLYRAHGFISAKLSERTGFSQEDLGFLWEALSQMFEHDRSAARGEMATRKLIAFRHDNALGKAPAHTLFDRIGVRRLTEDVPRCFADYEVTINRKDLPEGVEILEIV